MNNNELIKFWGDSLHLLDNIDDETKKLDVAKIYQSISDFILKTNYEPVSDFPQDAIKFEVLIFTIARRIYLTCGKFYDDIGEYLTALCNKIVRLDKITKGFPKFGSDDDLEAEYCAIAADLMVCDLLRKINE